MDMQCNVTHGQTDTHTYTHLVHAVVIYSVVLTSATLTTATKIGAATHVSLSGVVVAVVRETQ